MNYRMLAQGLALSILVASPLAAQGTAGAPKFAYIDSRQIIEKAPGRASMDSLFQREYSAAQESVKKMQDTLQAMVSAYQKVQSTLTPVTRELREKEIREKQQAFENRANLLDAQMQQRQGELVQPMMDQIRKVLETIRGEDGYTFIFDVAAQGGSVVAADTTLNITQKVLARLKPITASARADSTKVPAGAKPAPAGITKPIKPPEG